MISPNPYQNTPLYGPNAYGAPMMPPYPPGNGAGFGYSSYVPPVTPAALSTSRTQITTTTTTAGMVNPMTMTTSNVNPMMMGYETGMMNGMGGYGATMVNSTVVPAVTPMGVGCIAPGMVGTTVNSNSRVLIGNSNSRVIIAPPIYNKAVIQQRPVETRV